MRCPDRGEPTMGRRRLAAPMYDVRRRQTGSAYVRSTMYDVRLGCSRALRGGAVAAVSAYMDSADALPRRVKTGDGPKQPQGGAGESTCDYSARCAGQQSKCERDVVKPCADVVTKARDGGGAEARRMHEAVRGVWRRFRGCLSCWVVVQSGCRFCKSRRIRK